jgi:hypothetical protein
MTTDVLETILEEAEAIVQAEWLRLQHDTVSPTHARHPVRSEMPAARPRPPTSAMQAQLTNTQSPHPYGTGQGGRPDVARRSESGHATVPAPQAEPCPAAKPTEVMP